MVYTAFASLLIGAAVCFSVGRAAPARLLGLAATAVTAATTAMVTLAPLPPEGAPTTLLTLGEAVFSVGPGLDPSERALALALLGGGSATMLALAGAIAPAVRGFGAIFAWALICLAAALLSLAAPPLSLAQPLAWAVLALAGYAALRASGAATSKAPPLGLTFGLLASVLLAGGLLATGGLVAAGDLPGWPAALCGLVAALALAGSPPLAGARAEAVTAPAPLGALVYGLAAPAAALGWLLRVMALLPAMPGRWSLALGLIGGVGMLACGAGALGIRSLRPLLAWITAGQSGAVVMAAGLVGPLAAVAGPSLLLTLMLSTALGAVGVATLERTTGSDDYTAGGAAPPLVAGAVWALAASTALGLPPTWGFWPRLWLLQAAQEQQPWLLLLLLAGSVLTVLALLVPLAKLWGGAGAAGRASGGWADVLPALLVGLPLLALGVAPGLAWEVWLEAAPFAPATLPAPAEAQAAALSAGLALVALVAAIILSRPARALERDPEEEETRLAPTALGESVRLLAWLGNPEPLLGGLWALLQRASEALRFAMGLFEQRYYLLGVLAALLTIMLLMAQ